MLCLSLFLSFHMQLYLHFFNFFSMY